MSELPPEEVVEIVTGFLLNSPPGEFMEVVTDVRALLSKESLLNQSAPRVFREYNTEQMLQVESPGHDHKVLITKYGEVSDGEFLDPRGNQVITFDHIKQEVLSQRPISNELDSGLEPLRKAFDKAAADYATQHYPSGTSTTYAKDGQIIVCISSARFNPNNFWNGRWRVVWTYQGGTLTAHFKIIVHYYEDGNVQLTVNTTQAVSVPDTGKPDDTAANAFKAIAKAEQTYQQSVESGYSAMGETTFKALRRALPITRTKIDWGKIKSAKLGGEMMNKG